MLLMLASRRRIKPSWSNSQCSLPCERSGDRTALKELHRPLDAVHATHAHGVGVFERLGLFKILRLGVHHPNIGTAIELTHRRFTSSPLSSIMACQIGL